MEIVFLWAGLLFAWMGALITRFSETEFSGAQRVDGEVIGYVPHTDSEGSLTYAPVIAFAHPFAGRRILQSAIGSRDFLYPVGAHVKVLADRQHPDLARIDTNAFRYFGLAFIAAGLGLCVFFFFIFDWSFFSVALAVLVSAAVLWRGRAQREALSKVFQMGGLVRQALGGTAVEAARFDRSKLLSSADLTGARWRTARQSAIGSVILVLLGIAGLVGSWVWTERRLAFVQRAVPAEGRVVALVASSGGDSTTYAPVVEFTPPHATSAIRFRHWGSNSTPRWRVGQNVRVLHDPLDPSNAMIDEGWWTTGFPMILGAVAGVMTIMGLLSLYRIRRQERISLS